MIAFLPSCSRFHFTFPTALLLLLLLRSHSPSPPSPPSLLPIPTHTHSPTLNQMSGYQKDGSSTPLVGGGQQGASYSGNAPQHPHHPGSSSAPSYAASVNNSGMPGTYSSQPMAPPPPPPHPVISTRGANRGASAEDEDVFSTEYVEKQMRYLGPISKSASPYRLDTTTLEVRSQEAHTHTHTDTDRHTDRHRHTYRHRQTDTDTDTQKIFGEGSFLSPLKQKKDSCLFVCVFVSHLACPFHSPSPSPGHFYYSLLSLMCQQPTAWV